MAGLPASFSSCFFLGGDCGTAGVDDTFRSSGLRLRALAVAVVAAAVAEGVVLEVLAVAVLSLRRAEAISRASRGRNRSPLDPAPRAGD